MAAWAEDNEDSESTESEEEEEEEEINGMGRELRSIRV